MINTLHKSLTIAFLAVSIFISGLSIDLAGAQNTAVGSMDSRRPADPLLSKYLRFRHLNEEQGLSSSTAWDVMKDRRGYLWIATFDGLNRYDGYNMTVYKHDPENSESISSNFIKCVFQDHTDTIWVGTANGFNKFDPTTEKFVHYTFEPSVSDQMVDEIYEDARGRLWIGSWHGFLYQFDRMTETLVPASSEKQFERILDIVENQEGILWIGDSKGLTKFDPEAQTFIPYSPIPNGSTRVINIEIDREGILWLATVGTGLSRFDPNTEKFAHYRHDPENPQSLSSDAVMAVLVDDPGILWVGTFGGGLNRFDIKTGKFNRYQTNPYLPDSLSDNRIPVLLKDRQNTLWLGTFGNGVDYYNRLDTQFNLYRHIPGESQSLSHNEVWAVRQAPNKALWIGTLNGIDRLDPETGIFTHYQSNTHNPDSLIHNQIQALHIDKKGLVWIGTWRGGLDRLDPVTNRFTHYVHNQHDPKSLSFNEIEDIAEDRLGNIWVATYGGGLNRFDRKTEQFTRYLHDNDNPHSLNSNLVLSVYVTSANVLWIGTNNGLNRFDAEAKQFVRYSEYFQEAIYMVHERKDGVLWVAGRGGLKKFHPQTGILSTYTTQNGLANNIVYGILEDEQGNLWLNTAKGISKFNLSTEEFQNFDRQSGIQKKEFVRGSAYRTGDGKMFFGGRDGLNAFYPESIRKNDFIPPVVLTDFKLANQSVALGKNSPLQKVIDATDELILSHKDRVFAFVFAALNYVSPEKNQYAYKMEGFDRDWTRIDNSYREAKYTNLDAQTYTFKVKASNNDGVWNEEGRSILITILPPWWQTMWFKISVVAVAVGLLAGGFRWRVGVIENKRRELEIQVQKRTQELAVANQEALEAKDAADEANWAKSLFLANMSHELRTPLNAILGFSRMLAQGSKATADEKEKLAIINRSGQHLLSMINDVLELSKIEAGKIELQEDPLDPVNLIKEISVMIQSRAGEKGLSIVLETETASRTAVKADAGKLRQILINLLNNAVKFTDEGGVTIRYATEAIPEEPNRCHIVIEVEDTGPGIDPARQAQIFEPFVQGTDKPVRKSTGLGLSICKKYAELMGGTIELESEVGKGSLFRLRLLAEIAETADVKIPVDDKLRVIGLAPIQKTWRILVADDNPENLLLLKSVLEEVGFFVFEAKNGQEAVEAFKKQSPDFIWMDMRMPVMDGYEAARQIRQCPGGDTVPIIAITASAFGEQRHEILAAGCNDMVIKPFQAQEIFETMGRLLDIEYIYEPEEKAAQPRKIETILTSAMLAGLPAELLQELRGATISLNSEAITAVIEHIEPLAPDTAKGLRMLLDDLQMGRLLELIEKVKG